MSAAQTGKQVVVITAPSGAGKTTIAHRVMQQIPELRFSVSATTRPPRDHEQEGRDYYFVTGEQFKKLVEEEAFLEYEEVYPGRYYGTLRSEVERVLAGAPVLLDVDVKGALSVKRVFGQAACTIFIRPPDLDTLAERLRRRATETEHTLRQRLDRARLEMSMASQFDAVVVNDDLDRAVSETLGVIHSFLGS